MTITIQEKQVPTDLPPARLYLDDIEMIIRAMTETRKPLSDVPNASSRGGAREPVIKFEIEGRECTEIADLPKVAERTGKMLVTAEIPGTETDEADGWAAVQIAPNFTRWHSLGLTPAEQWSLLSRLEPIFQDEEATPDGVHPQASSLDVLDTRANCRGTHPVPLISPLQHAQLHLPHAPATMA